MDAAMCTDAAKLSKYRLVLGSRRRPRPGSDLEAGSEREEPMNVGHRVLLPALREVARVKLPVVCGSQSGHPDGRESLAPESSHSRSGRLEQHRVAATGGVACM